MKPLHEGGLEYQVLLVQIGVGISAGQLENPLFPHLVKVDLAAGDQVQLSLREIVRLSELQGGLLRREKGPRQWHEVTIWAKAINAKHRPKKLPSALQHHTIPGYDT